MSFQDDHNALVKGSRTTAMSKRRADDKEDWQNDYDTGEGQMIIEERQKFARNG